MKKAISTLTLISIIYSTVFIGYEISFASSTKTVGATITYPMSDSTLGVDAGSLVHEPQSNIDFRFNLRDRSNSIVCFEDISLPVVNGFISYDLGSQHSINILGNSTGCNMNSILSNTEYSITILGDLNRDGDFSDAVDFSSDPVVWTQSPTTNFLDSFLDSKTLDIQKNMASSGSGSISTSSINYDFEAAKLSTRLIANSQRTRNFDLNRDGIVEVFSKGNGNGIIYGFNKESELYENISSSGLITLQDDSNAFVQGKNFNFVIHGSFSGNPVIKNNLPVTLISLESGTVIYESYTLEEFVLNQYLVISLGGVDTRFTFNSSLRVFEQDLSITFGEDSGLFDSTTSDSWNGTPFAGDETGYYGGDIREGEVNGFIVNDSDGLIYGDFNNDERLDFISYKNQSGGKALFSVFLQTKDEGYKMILDSFLGDGITAGTSIIDNGLKPRYIRDYTNGSNLTTTNAWVEIEVIEETTDVNVASGIIPTTDITSGIYGNLSVLTNGNLGSWEWTGRGSAGELNYMQLDLGDNYNISEVNVWHYYADNRTFFQTKTEISEDGNNWYSLFDSSLQGTYVEPTNGSGISHKNTFSDSNEIIIANGSTKNIFSINWGWENNTTGIGVNNTVTQIASFDSTFYSVLSEDGGTENVDNGFFAIGDGFSDMAEGNRDSEYLLVGNYMLNKDGLDYYDYKIKRYDGTSFIDLPLQSSGAPFRGIGNRISFVKAGNSDFNLFYIDQSSEYSLGRNDRTTLYYIYNNEVVKLGDFIVNPNNTISSQDGLGNEGGSKLLTNSTFGFNGDNISDISSGYFGIPKENYVSGNFNFTVEDSWIDMRDVTTAGATLTGNVTLNDKFIRSIFIDKATYTSNSRPRCGGAEQLDISLNGNLSYDLSLSEVYVYLNNPSTCGDINLEINKHYDSFSIDHILSQVRQASHLPWMNSQLFINYSEFTNEKEYFQVNNGNVVNFNSGTFDYGDIFSTSSNQGTVFRLSDLNMSDTGLQNLINSVSVGKNSYVQDSIERTPALIYYNSIMSTISIINNRKLNGYSSPVLNQSTILSNKDNVFLVIDKGEIGFISNNLTNLSPGIYRDNILGTHIGFIRNNTIDTGIRIGIPEPVSRPFGLIKWNASWLQPGYHGTGTNGDTTWVVNLFNNSGGNVVGTTSTDNYIPPAPYNVRLQPNTTASESVVWGNMGMSIDY